MSFHATLADSAKTCKTVNLLCDFKIYPIWVLIMFPTQLTKISQWFSKHMHPTAFMRMSIFTSQNWLLNWCLDYLFVATKFDLTFRNKNKPFIKNVILFLMLGQCTVRPSLTIALTRQWIERAIRNIGQGLRSLNKASSCTIKMNQTVIDISTKQDQIDIN